MSKKPAEYMTVDEILAMFAAKLDIHIQRPSLYHYIKRFGFPNNTQWGRPRKWDRAKVEKWFAKNKIA